MAWTLYKEIKYAASGIPAENLTDFPKRFLITTDADIAAELSGGGGIKLTSADGLTDLPFGLYPDSNLAAGTVHFRVLSSLLTAASVGDVIARLYYSSTGTTTEDKAGTVSNSYDIFMPMEEDPSGSAPQMFDWVSETNVGTANGSMTAGDLVSGQVGSGLDFDGSDDYVAGGSSPTTHPFTVEAIVNASAAGVAVSDDNVNSSISQSSLGVNSSGHAFIWDSWIGTSIAGSTDVRNAWHGIAGVFNTSSSAVYVDGVSENSGTLSDSTGGAGSTTIGARRSTSPTTDFLTGIIDEVRISSVARSANWLAYAYQDDFGNSDTFTLSAEQGGGGGTTVSPWYYFAQQAVIA